MLENLSWENKIISVIEFIPFTKYLLGKKSEAANTDQSAS